MALKNDSTLVTKGDLKKFYNKILPYMGGNYVFNTLGTKDYYSEDEKVIGVWTDGRPVYRKVYKYVSTMTLNKDTWTNSNIKLDNVDIIISSKVFGGSYGVYSDIQSSINGTVGIPSGTLAIYSTTVLYFDYLIIEYTKTTDAVNSAVDTIGCYDITRPDLWPENKEITFGNGLYGQRFIGTYTPVACSASTSVDPSGQVDTVLLSGVKYTQSIGGYAKGYNSSTYFPISTSNNVNANGIFVYVTQSGDLTLRSVCWRELTSSNITNKEYDIWVTYKKK